MPSLHWIGKDQVTNHHLDVPFRVLEHTYGFDNGQTTEQPTASGNKIIHGDNLEALKALLPEYEGKVKCIYIDPPYNTGSENWVYNDNVNAPRIKRWLGQVVGKESEDLSRHDKWLCMMYPRLKLLHKLLADDGAIFISLDENEVAHARSILSEVFGKNNFVVQITLLCNPKGRSQDKYFATNHEYCLVYSKNNLEAGAFSVEKDEEQVLKDYPNEDKNGRFRLPELRNTHREFSKGNRPNLFYPFYINPNDNTVSLIESQDYSVECLPIWNDGYEGCWTWGKDLVIKEGHLLRGYKKKSGWKVYRKVYAQEADGRKAERKLFSIFNNPKFYTERGQSTFGEIFPGLNKNDFPQPKSVDFIAEVINTITDKDSVVLDSFAGSGTTAHAVLNLNKQDGGNRKFILVEMEDYAESITAERVKRVISGYQFSGTQKVELESYSVNLTTLKKADAILEKYEAHRANPDFKNVSLESANGSMVISGKKQIEGSMPGLGGAFDYYELGPPLFSEEGYLNESVELDKIRRYVWYTETQSTYPAADAPDNAYFLGKYEQTAYYFYYEPHQTTTLDHAFLATVGTEAEQYTIYADHCLLTPEFMQQHHLVFKKIPRDISRF